MDEAGEVVAIALDRSQVIGREVVRTRAVSAVLTIEAHREHLEPDPVEIDASDVLPCDDGDELIPILDETNGPTLEPSTW